MRPTFHSLEVADIRRETKDCCSIEFSVPPELKEMYQFTQGQYLTLKTTINDEEVRRSYSICVSPLEGELRVAVKQVPHGKFSTFANQVLKVGDRLDVMNPMGTFFTEVSSDQSKKYIGVAAGSGITPVMSIMKTVLQTEQNSRFTLIYGNKNTKSIIFKEQIEALKNKYMDRLDVHYVLSRESLESPLYNGRIDGDKIRSFARSVISISDMDEVFICGPETMIFAVKDAIGEEGLSDQQIHFELFTTAGSTNEKQTRTDSDEELDRSISDIAIHLDGKSFSFELEKNSESILDAALEHGADLPFACKGGVCCTCKAKLLSGEVDMKVNYALEEEEVSAGYILTCQSYPISEKVAIEFDQY